MEPAASLPDSLVLETMEGESFDLGSLRGERTLIVTWASWWGCRKHLPGWQAAAEARKDQVRIVTVAMDAQGPDKPRRFVEKSKLTLPALVDRKGALWELYDFKVVPVQLYFDETGRLVHRSSGAPEGEALAKLDEALKAPRKPAGELVAAASPRPASAELREAAKLFERGVAALEDGRENAALALWKRALAVDPENWLIRKQIWTLENPDVFWGGEEIDHGWQKRRMASERQGG